MLENMRDLHPAGGGFSKVCDAWKYDGPHGSGNVRLYRRVNEPDGEAWEPQMFVAPATSWVYYINELPDAITMTADTCVTQLYRSLWIFILGLCGAVCSMTVGGWIAWRGSDIGQVRTVGICLTILRTLVVLWRWVSDLIMSNHHRGAWPRHRTPAGVPAISCRDYRRLHKLNAFPDADFAEDSEFQTSGRQIKTFLFAISQRMAQILQDRGIDWCADRFEVRYPNEEQLVELDVRVGDKSHNVTMPRYIADGLCTGTYENTGLTWSGIAVTVTYAWMLVLQFVLFLDNPVPPVLASLWLIATIIGIPITASLTGIPLVCSGVA